VLPPQASFYKKGNRLSALFHPDCADCYAIGMVIYMNKLLEYPFDPQLLMRKKKSIKKELLSSGTFIEKRIAILGGSTTDEVKNMLELFLLNYGIKPSLYESGYGRYWQEAVFDNAALDEFAPDVIYIHTSNRNIECFPTMQDSQQEINEILQRQYRQFTIMWDRLREKYDCPIIQNNFEPPLFRLLGNKDVSDIHGRINFINRINDLMCTYAQEHTDFYINDINYLSAVYGLDQWSDPFYWYMYKYALSLSAVPYLAFSVAKIIKSIFGKNKKAIMVDLDNTLWRGTIGEDGLAGIEVGQETPIGQAYYEFQKYLKAHRDLGILLNVNSKNSMENALTGLNHPEGILRPEDFVVLKANWENKDRNTIEIAQELNIGTDSLVFIDDNPAERELVIAQVNGVEAPAIEKVEHYVTAIDRCGFFEVTSFSEDDTKRNDMYKANIMRAKAKESFADYEEYLRSLEMCAEIRDFDDIYMQRISQLTNKTNQFNLTTKRFSYAEICAIAADDNYINLYGKLTDKYGDNGVVTVVMGKKDVISKTLDIEVWLMSCRVLKRKLEYAMLDVVVERAKAAGLKKIRGYYFRTKKNAMVANFYEEMGFSIITETADKSIWELDVADYKPQNHIITVLEGK